MQPKKCKLFCRYLRYLGIVMGNGELLQDPSKVASIVHMSRPKNRTELRKFIGAALWFKSWVPSWAQIQKPLNKLLKDKIMYEGEEIELQDKRAWKPGSKIFTPGVSITSKQ